MVAKEGVFGCQSQDKVKNPILIIAEALDFEVTAKANSR